MTEHAQVIVGASHAGVSLALQLRKEGWQGPIQLVGAETQLPYHRPPLSKDLLSGTKTLDGIRLRPEKVYADNKIELILGAVATKIDRDARTVDLDCGRTLLYDKLALCTGARVREFPGAPQSDRILYLRNAEDALRLQRLAKSGSRAVIIGGGYIGLEAAAALQKLGLEVTVLEMADRVLERVTSETLSSYLTTLHAMHGVSVKTGCSVTCITGGEDETQALSVECGDG
ncbi:MAG: NAD(P)/FAD-dependent oxidoreductase, partial [Pseudohongiellaceae bacterium]